MKKFFESPVQVKFRVDEETMKEEGRAYLFGIAYHNEIICGCCGGVFEVEECEEIVEYEEWTDIEDGIGGEEYYDSLMSEFIARYLKI